MDSLRLQGLVSQGADTRNTRGEATLCLSGELARLPELLYTLPHSLLGPLVAVRNSRQLVYGEGGDEAEGVGEQVLHADDGVVLVSAPDLRVGGFGFL